MKCPTCGTKNRTELTFCQGCGELLPAAATVSTGRRWMTRAALLIGVMALVGGALLVRPWHVIAGLTVPITPTPGVLSGALATLLPATQGTAIPPTVAPASLAAPTAQAAPPLTGGFAPESLVFVHPDGGPFLVSDSTHNRIDLVNPGLTPITLYGETVAGHRTVVVAGTGQAGFAGDGGPATQAILDGVGGIDVDASANLYLTDSMTNRLRRVDAATGVITTVAGTGQAGDAGDGGPATQAQLAAPFSVAVGHAGYIYVADWASGLIRVISPDGIIHTLVGQGPRGSGAPLDLRVTPTGTLLMASSYCVRAVDPARQTISTIAGTCGPIAAIDPAVTTKPPAQTLLGSVYAMTTDTVGNVYLATNTVIREIDPTLTHWMPVAAEAGGTPPPGSADAWPSLVDQGVISGLAVDGAGTIYASTSHYHAILTFQATTGHRGIVVGWDGTVAPRQTLVEQPTDTPAPVPTPFLAIVLTTPMASPSSSATVAPTGTPTVAPTGTPTVAPTGTAPIPRAVTRPLPHMAAAVIPVHTSAWIGGMSLAGDGHLVFSGLSGPLSGLHSHPHVWLANITGVPVTLYGHRVPPGVSVVVAGNGQGDTTVGGYGGDNIPATKATITSIEGLAVDTSYNVYIADTVSRRIRKVDAHSGRITPVLNTLESKDLAVDGQMPKALTFDSKGYLYFLSAVAGAMVFRLDPRTGTVTPVLAHWQRLTDAEINLPGSVAVDQAGTVFIGDVCCVRRIDHGIIRTVPNTGQPTNPHLSGTGVTVDGPDTLLVAYPGFALVARVNVRTGRASVVVNAHTRVDGGAHGQAPIGAPSSVVVDDRGDIFIVDTATNRILMMAHDTGQLVTVVSGPPPPVFYLEPPRTPTPGASAGATASPHAG